MSLPGDTASGLVELEDSSKFEFIYPQGGNEMLEQVGEGLSPVAGEDIWAIGVVVKDYAEGIIGQEETELEYEPRDAKRLKRDYRRSYKELVAPLQAMAESEEVNEEAAELEERILVNAVRNMEQQGVRLLGGFCVNRGPRPGQIFPAVFFTKTLSACYGRTMREISLRVDTDRDLMKKDRTDENLELLHRAINLERIDQFSVLSGAMVASLLPHPATVSPSFGQGPKPLA